MAWMLKVVNLSGLLVQSIFKISIAFIFVFILLISFSFGQSVESDERASTNYKDGLKFSKDSLFLMNLRFRMQNRAGFNTFDGDGIDINEFEMRVRRLRLRFDGYVISPRFQYYIQLGFSKADLDLEVNNVAQPIRDALAYYYVNKNLYFGFGQGKLPGNRQRVVSSGNLQFADRSIANGLFTLDRDFGFFGYYSKKVAEDSYFLFKGAISSGEGRNSSRSNSGLAYTGRVEFLPLGKFINSGDYSEGDIEFEPKPKLSVGMTLSKNFSATRTGGQIGQSLYENRDISALILDGMFKYRGNAVLMEFLKRSSPNPFTVNDFNDVRFVQVGHGVNLQISRMLSSKSELAIRYAAVIPDEIISDFQDRADEAILGYTHYFRGHRIKMQGNVGYKWLEGLSDFNNTGNFWTGMFQVEFGI